MSSLVILPMAITSPRPILLPSLPFARVAALPRPNGRVALFNCTLREVTADGEHEQELTEGQTYLDALKTHFGIELDVPYEAIRPLPQTLPSSV